MENLFQISDHYSGNFTLMGKDPIIEAKTGREALNKYLKEKGLNIKTKVSGSNHVQFGVTPMIEKDGTIYIYGGKRKMWYQVIE